MMGQGFGEALYREIATGLLIGVVIVAILSVGGWELAKYLAHHLSLVWR